MDRKEIMNIMVADNLEWAKNFLENYQPIKINGEWYPSYVIIPQVDGQFQSSDAAFQFMRTNANNLSGNTIQLSQVSDNQFAYLFYSQ